MRLNKGFTLVELMIYSAIFVIVIGIMTGVMLTSIRTQNRNRVDAEVSQQLDLVLATTQRLVRDASLIDVSYEGTSTSTSCSTYCSLRLRTEASSTDPIIISSNAGGVYLKEGSSDAVPLTTDKIIVDYLRFTKFEVAGGHAAVQIDASFSYNTSNPQVAVTKKLQSAISRVSAATFDSDLLPNADNTYSIGGVSPDQRWMDARFSGDLSVEGSASVGTSTLNSSAVLLLESDSKGFLPPRLTTSERNGISSPTTGLMVYNTTTGQYEFYDGSSWSSIGGSDDDWTIVGSDVQRTTGNVSITNTLTAGDISAGTLTITDTYGTTLYVPDGGYAQFMNGGYGAPPSYDCNSDSERGRIYIRTDTNPGRLYICIGWAGGWDYEDLTNI